MKADLAKVIWQSIGQGSKLKLKNLEGLLQSSFPVSPTPPEIQWGRSNTGPEVSGRLQRDKIKIQNGSVNVERRRRRQRLEDKCRQSCPRWDLPYVLCLLLQRVLMSRVSLQSGYTLFNWTDGVQWACVTYNFQGLQNISNNKTRLSISISSPH